MMRNKVIVKYLFLKLVFILTMHSQGATLQQFMRTGEDGVRHGRLKFKCEHWFDTNNF